MYIYGEKQTETVYIYIYTLTHGINNLQDLKADRWKRFSYHYIWILLFENYLLHMCMCGFDT